MSFEPIDVDAALGELHRVLTLRPEVAGEFELSRAEFLVEPRASRSDEETRRAARRHAEWFLLERPCSALGGAPVEWALHNRGELAEAELDDESLQALISSRCGVFEITSVKPGEGAWVRDLGAGGEYPLHEPSASLELAPGDVIVGRLFAVGAALYGVSPAAGVFRNTKLLAALARDMDRLRLGRRGVLRLSQLELEHMFWGGAAGESGDADPAARARSFLLESGVDAEKAAALLAELQAAPFEPERFVHGVRDGLAVVLDRLAFESDVDLEQARRVLLEAWPALSAPDPGADAKGSLRGASKPPRGSVQAAMEAFDRGRDAGRDLEELFRELEQDLELESEEIDPDGIDGAPAPDFPGVVGAMVEEFLWDTEREHGAAAAREAAAIAKFAQFGAHLGVFENLGGHELLLFAALWLPERGELDGAGHARAVLTALRRFCEWSQASQDVALADAYATHVAALEDTLPRVSEANLRRRVAASDPSAGTMFELVACDGGLATLRDRRGAEQRATLALELLGHLAPGDWIRATLTAGTAEVHCCYPPQVAALAP